MEELNKTELIKHISLGTDEVLYYPYNERKEPLPLRPISSFELDQCFYNALRFAPTNISNLVIDIKLKLVDSDRDINITDEGYVKIQEYYDSVDFWIVYYAMKDFQSEGFRELDFNELECHPKGFYLIKDKMKEIHEIAEFVIASSYQTEEIIEEVFQDATGKEIGLCVYYLNIPLTELKNMTRLQRDYLVYSKIHLKSFMRGKAKEDGYIFSDQKMTLKEFLERMGIANS